MVFSLKFRFFIAFLPLCIVIFYGCDNVTTSTNNTGGLTTSLLPKVAPMGEQECFEFQNIDNKKEGATLTLLREGEELKGNLDLKSGTTGLFHGKIEHNVAFCEWNAKTDGKLEQINFQLTAKYWNTKNDLTLVFDENDDATELKRIPCKGANQL